MTLTSFFLYLLGAILSLFAFLFRKGAKPGRIPLGPRPSQYSRQSKEVRQEKPRGEGAVRRAADVPDGELPDVLRAGGKTLTTVYQAFQFAVSNYGAYPCLGTRSVEKDGTRGRFKWSSYKQVAQRRNRFASGLANLGVKPGDRVGIYSKNREEWIITEQACYAHSYVIVSFYDTLGEDAVEYIANHSETSVVICSKESTLKLLAVADKCEALRVVIQMEDIGEKEKAAAEGKKVRLLSFEEVIKDGGARPQEGRKPESEDLCTIMYTSGTTGPPKGVLLTHKNLVATMGGAEGRLENLVSLGDSYLSYLPLAHIFERVVVNTALYRGCRVGFYQGDVRKIIDDVAELKPSFFAGVPRVFDKIYDRINNMVNSGSPLRKYLFKKAIEASEHSIKTGKSVPLIWDLLVLRKIRAKLGGNVACMLSGSAPLTPTVQRFMRACFGCPVIQGYGLTETCAGATISYIRDTDLGHVGAPIGCCEIKLVDVEEMEYTSRDKPLPRGEIALKGPHISAGYYKDEKKTAEDFRDGWFFTGDIGRWNADGTLSIIDRKKNIFKLSQGEYIAAEKLEGVYARSKYVAQVWVYGDSTKSTLVAVVHPDPEVLIPWAKENGLPTDMKTLCKNKKVNELILKDMTVTGIELKLRGFEMVKAVHLFPEEFSMDNDLVTPTFKLKRPQLQKFFSEQIEKMYDSIPPM